MKLLSIGIPTYKRPAALKQCLLSLIHDLSPENMSKLAIIVSDNDPDSKNESMIKDICLLNKIEIKYIRNSTNIGAEKNFLQCAQIAPQSEYFWILGDDDFIVPGRTADILQQLESLWLDCIYLESRPIYWSTMLPKKPIIIKDSNKFLQFVNYHTTFVSAFIWRTQHVRRQLNLAESYVGSSFIHLSWVLPTIGSAENFLIFPKKSITGGRETTGGYELGAVFVQNFWRIWTEMTSDFSKSLDPNVTITCRNLMLLIFYPSILAKLRSKSSKFRFEREDSPSIFKHKFRRFPLYWISTAPCFFLPLVAIQFLRLILLAIALPIIWRITCEITRISINADLNSKQFTAHN